MKDNEVIEKYGQPGVIENLTYFDSPFPLVIAWDTKHTINRFSVHWKILTNIEACFDCLLHEYGLEDLQRLGIDQFGGCYNFRKMRGGKRWSRHSWAIAIDLLPTGNGLRTRAPKALFSQPEYKRMLDIFYEHNFINYGVEKGYDWMHFEIKD